MPDIRYRVYYDGTAATQKQLDRIDHITVDQVVDKAWQARIVIPACLDEKGNWKGEDEKFMQAFSRVRIEIQAGSKPYVALIDGPVVGFDNAMSSEPGQSQIVLLVYDDTVYLDREEVNDQFTGLKDSQIATKIFSGLQEHFTRSEVDPTSDAADALASDRIQRGSLMDVLRSLAKRNGMHAWVWPADEKGKNVANFKAFPTSSNGLEPLVLMGDNRNIQDFSVKNNTLQASRCQAFTLKFSDKTVLTSTSGFRNLSLLGPDQGFDKDTDTALQILRPEEIGTRDPKTVTEAKTSLSAYAFEATGTVWGDCYPDILRPYQVISVLGANGKLSGDYVITRVKHRLTWSDYFQEFSLVRNAQSSGKPADASAGGLMSSAVNTVGRTL